MKTAKQMFEELGWEYKEESFLCHHIISYTKNKDTNNEKVIEFEINGGGYLTLIQSGHTVRPAYILNLKEIQAINKQVEELGWGKEE